MYSQRVDDGESSAVAAYHNGPQRAWRIIVYHDARACVSCRGYVSILLSVRMTVKQGGTAGFDIFRLVLDNLFVEDGFFVYLKKFRIAAEHETAAV